MKRTAAYRFTSDICFYYSVLSIFPFMLPLQESMALFTAASFAVSLAAVYCPWAPLRFLIALLPGLAFLRAPLSYLLVFPALAWLYLILVLTAGRFHIWLDDYRHSFWIMLWLCFFSMVSGVLLNTISPGLTVLLPGMVYATAFLWLGVFAMRRLQINAAMGLPWNLANGAAVIGVPLLAAGFALLLWRLLGLFAPVFRFLSPYLRSFLAWLVNTIFPGNPDAPPPTPTPEATLSPAEKEIVKPGLETPTPTVSNNWELDPAMLEKLTRIGIGVLIVLLVLILVIVILLMARRSRSKAVQEEFFFEETEDDEPVQRRKAGKTAPLTNAGKLRNVYRQYMKLMRGKGVVIRKGSTSREILSEAELLNFSPDARRLRELYLKARYDDPDSVTREEVQEAALCLRRVRGDEGWNQ